MLGHLRGTRKGDSCVPADAGVEPSVRRTDMKCTMCWGFVERPHYVATDEPEMRWEKHGSARLGELKLQVFFSC